MKKLERIDKIISNMGYGSRKQVKQYIKEGRIKVEDKVIKDNKYKLNPYEAQVFFDGEKVIYKEYIYVMMNKPKGLVSSTDDPHTKTVVDILEHKYALYNPFPVGRLDKDTEGLLLISNDGQMAHELLSPKKKVDKKYYVEVNGFIEEKHIDLFKAGIKLEDGYETLPAELEIIEGNIISKAYLTIKEGKFHQVKRMFKALSMEVIYLKRISMGNLVLDETLKPGEYRELKEEEKSLLIKTQI